MAIYILIAQVFVAIYMIVFTVCINVKIISRSDALLIILGELL